MKKGIIILSALISFNISAAEIGQGEWYRFTNDFINNCVKSIVETKENSTETEGKTVSSVNPPVSLQDCLSSNPYLDSESQIAPPELGDKGCGSKVISNYILDTASNGQKVEILSKNRKEKTTFECVNGNWNQLTSKTVGYTKSNCSAVGVVWNNEEYVLENTIDLVSKRRIENCYNNLPTLQNGRTVKLKSYGDLSYGEIKMFCDNGTWKKEEDYVQTCFSEYCNLSQQVTWYDKEVFEKSDYNNIESGGAKSKSDVSTSRFSGDSISATISTNNVEEDIQNLKKLLSTNGASKEEIIVALKDIMEVLNAQQNDGQYVGEESGSNNQEPVDTGSDSNDSSSNPFKENPNLKDRPVCFSKNVTSYDGGKTGFVSFYQPDKRYFKTEVEALEKSNIIEGNATLNCVKGRWIVNEDASKCYRKTNFSCVREAISKTNGEFVYMFKCGNQS